MIKLKKVVLFLSFIMIFGIITAYIPRNYVEATSDIEEMDIRTAPETDLLGKVWKIEFNKDLKQEDLINNELIYVEDALGNIHETTLSLSKEDKKIVLVTPDVDYENYKPYTLYVLKGLKNVEDDKVIDKTVKMEFMIKVKVDKTIDTAGYPNNKFVLENETIYGDLIITGGGQVTLKNVVVNGNIIVEDVSEDSLILDRVKAGKLEINDTNGARIFISQPKQNGDAEEFSILNEIDINEMSNNPITLEGDFSSTTVNIKKPVEIKIAKGTSIAEVKMETTEAKITSKDNSIDMAASIGNISGTISEELKAMKADVENNKIKLDNLINTLNNIPKDQSENYDIYLDRGRQTKSALEELLGDKVGQDYNNYTEHMQIRTANTVRAFMENRKFTTINQVESAFTNAKEWNKVFGEGMKYAAYHGYMDIDIEYKWPVISKDIEIGMDITDTILRLADNVTEDQLNKDITVTILHEYEWNSGKYLNIDTENQRIYLERLNKSDRPINISIMFSIIDTISGMESTTNFIVTLEPQVSNIGVVNLTSNKNQIVPWIDNIERWLNTYDNVRIGQLKDAIESSQSSDIINIVDAQEEVITNMDMYVEGFMKLEVNRGDDSVYYRISADPVLISNNDNIIKRINGRTIEVNLNSKVENVINSLDKRHDYYKLTITDKSGKELNNNDNVENGMYLMIDAGNNRYRFDISIYIGEINLTIEDYSIVNHIDKENKRVNTYDNINVQDFLNAIRSTTNGDILKVVDSNNDLVGNDSIINGRMKLEINREGNKIYYIIGARPIISSNNKDVIKETGTRMLTVYPGKTIEAVIAAINTNHDFYKLNVRYINDRDMITDHSKVVENGMELLIDTGNSRYSYEISIYIGPIELISLNPSIIDSMNIGDKTVYTYDNVKVGNFLVAIKSDNGNDILNVVDKNNKLVDATDFIINSMKLEINRGGNKSYFSIGAIPILDIKDKDVIKEILHFWNVLVYPNKTVEQVINALEPRYNTYQLRIEDGNENSLNDNAIVEEGMDLFIETGNGGYIFTIRTYLEDMQP